MFLQAKHELKRKKLLEQRMDKLLTMVDNLSVLESQIEDAESDAMVGCNFSCPITLYFQRVCNICFHT